MKIAILGAGALGCYYGARLAAAGNDVSFIMRSDYDFVHKNGLHIKSVHGDIRLNKVKVFKTASEAGPVDLVIVAWKTTSNTHLPDSLPPLIDTHTTVLTLQNGMGNGEAISEIVSPENIYLGLCFICAMHTNPGEITHLDSGDIQFAPYKPSKTGYNEATKLADFFSNAGIPAKSFEQAEQIQWFKLVWNIPFNGLCLAKKGINIAQLYKDPANVIRARKIMEEVVAAAKARGYELPESTVDFQMKITEKMGDFTPSSAVDYNLNRPIEYHAIWEQPLQKARKSGIKVPEWEKLNQEIRSTIGY